MPLQKCLLFKKIYKKVFWANTSSWLSDCNAELSKKLKSSNGKPDGFIKLLTKRISYIGLTELVNMVINFMKEWKCLSLSHVQLYDPMDSCLPGSLIDGILQARILGWVAIPFSRGSSQPRDQPWVSCIGRWILYHLSHQGRPSCMWIRAYSDIQCSSLTFFFCYSFSDKRERNYKTISLGRW